LKPLKKSGNRPDAINVGMVKASITIRLGKFAKAIKPEVKELRRSIKARKITIPIKYMLDPP
jgi:hypothetical protein